MFSAVDGFRTTTINVANGYISTFNANVGCYTAIPTSDGNTLYIAGVTVPTVGDNNTIWLKVNNINGARITVEKSLSNSFAAVGYIGSVDSSENVYIVGETTDASASPNSYAVIAKYSSSGTLDWQRNLIGPTTGALPTSATHTEVICETGGGNIYAAGGVEIPTGNVQTSVDALVKYNNSGTILTQESVGYFNVGNTVYAQEIKDLSVDSSNNLYISGYVPQSFDGNVTYKTSATVQKRNSSGTIQWDSNLYDNTNSGNVTVETSVIDSNLEVYTCGVSVGGSPPPAFVSKFYANGTLAWAKDYTNCEVRTLSVDNTGNLYAAGRLSNDSSRSWYASIDTSTGNINWQNFIVNNTGNFILNDINYANSYLYMGGYNLPGTFTGVTMKLHSNGNTTGTHGAFTFSTGNVATGTSNLTAGGNNYSFSSTSYANQAGSLSSISGSASRRIIPL